jgi:tRNA-2-methylthio-N6-dimethylallyladenosine synthase
MTDLPKTYRVKSFGCQMNVYDGERMAELLAQKGMRAASDAEDADLVVLNTCHIRERAAEKAYSDVGRLRREDGSKPMIALAGCVAQAEGAEAKTRSKMIDLVVGPQAYHRLPEMVAEAASGQRPVDTDMPAISKFGALPGRRRAGRAPPPVQEGCDKFCTYCVVPYTRGAEISRRWPRSSPKRSRWRRRRARDHPARPERQPGRRRWRPRLVDPRNRRGSMAGALRYTTSHPTE